MFLTSSVCAHAIKFYFAVYYRLFCFILSFGDFVSPYYLGGSKPPTLPILIVDTVKSGQQWPRAAVVAVVMMVTLFVVAFAGIMAAYRRRVG